MLIRLLAIVFLFCGCSEARKLNFVVIVGDDMGWSDVGFNGGGIPTPTLDSLAHSGVILDNYYTHPVCTPSRAALMTGRYASNAGLPGPLLGSSPFGLPESMSTLAEELHSRGYATHMVGKWHLGFAKWSMTPLQRGFDTFFGCYGGAAGHYSKYLFAFYDLRKGPVGYFDASRTHSTTLFANEAIQRIHEHGALKRSGHDKPFFLYLPFLAAHAPLQADPHHVAKCAHLPTERRQKFCALVAGMDEAVANITKALKEEDMEDTVIIFTTDNGGMPHEGGSPYPFRGTKLSAFEGGARGPAFVTGPSDLFSVRSYRYKGLFHIADWFSTILYLSDTEGKGSPDYTPKMLKRLRGQIVNTEPIDGLNMWHAISTNGTSPREEAVITIDPYIKEYAIRIGRWKLILGHPHDGEWYGAEATSPAVPNPTILDYLVEFAEDAVVKILGEDAGYFYREVLNHFRIRANTFAGLHLGPRESQSATPLPEGTFLFDLEVDPQETKNLYDERPDIVQRLKQRLQDLEKKAPTLQADWRRADFRALESGQAADPRFPDKLFIGPWVSEASDVFEVETQDVYFLLLARIRKFLRRSLVVIVLAGVVLPALVWRYWKSRKSATNDTPNPKLEKNEKSEKQSPITLEPDDEPTKEPIKQYPPFSHLPSLSHDLPNANNQFLHLPHPRHSRRSMSF
jgi:arylsulfatase A-like enzyme